MYNLVGGIAIGFLLGVLATIISEKIFKARMYLAARRGQLTEMDSRMHERESFH